MHAVRRVAPKSSSAPNRLSERLLQQMIDALQTTLPHQQGLRRWPRLSLEGFLTLKPLGAAERGNARQVGVYDISRTGVAVVDDRPAFAGEQFALQIPRKMRRAIEVLCTVRNCRGERGAFIIGAEYGTSCLDAMNAMLLPPSPHLVLTR